MSTPRGSVRHGQKYLSAARHDWAVDYKTSWRLSTTRRSPGGSGPHGCPGTYGGYMTNWVITQTNRFKASVTMRIPATG